MLRLEDFMEIQKLHHDGVSISEIGRRMDLDRKTVRKYLREAPRPYQRKPKPWKIDVWRSYFAGAMGARGSQRPPLVLGDPKAWL